MTTDIPRFPTTDWSMLAHAADERAACRRLSMEQLLRRYLVPMRRYLLAQRQVQAQQVDDLLQSFITERVVGSDFLKHADRTRGRFRNLLIRALTNYAIDRHRREQARDAGLMVLQITDDACVPSDGQSDPARQFDHLWAQHVIMEALERTRLRLRDTDRERVWDLFSRRMLDSGSKEGCHELAERFGFATPTQVSSALLTAKRVFARQLRDVLAEYGGDQADLDEELRDLKQIFERSRAWR